MKRSFLTCSLFGYLVLSSSGFTTAADLVSHSRRPNTVTPPYTIIISTPDEVRLLKSEQRAESGLPTIVQIDPKQKVGGPLKIEFQHLNFNVLASDEVTETENLTPKVIHSTYHANDEKSGETNEGEPEQLDSPDSPSDLDSATSDDASKDQGGETAGGAKLPEANLEEHKDVHNEDRAENADSNEVATNPVPSVRNEHDIHQPLRLPEVGAAPNVDLKNDPVYKELLKVFQGAMNEPGSDEPIPQKFRFDKPSEKSDRGQVNYKLLDAQFHAAEDLLKVARSLEKPAKKFRKLDMDAESEKLREAIAKIRAIAAELSDNDSEEDDD